jgi:hypothetical protein
MLTGQNFSRELLGSFFAGTEALIRKEDHFVGGF